MGIAWSNAPLVLGMTVGLITLKSLIVALVCTLARLKLGTAIRSGLLLSQGGLKKLLLVRAAHSSQLGACRGV